MIEAFKELSPWDTDDATGKFIASLAAFFNSKTILELGTYTGRTSTKLMQITPPDGLFVSVDIEDRRPEFVKELFNSYQYSFIKSDSIKYLDSLVDTMLSGKHALFDFVFIDTVHEFDHMVKEYQLAESIVKPGGLILIHDTWLFEGGQRFVEWLKSVSKNGTNIEILDLPTCGDNDGFPGLCVTRKLAGWTKPKAQRK